MDDGLPACRPAQPRRLCSTQHAPHHGGQVRPLRGGGKPPHSPQAHSFPPCGTVRDESRFSRCRSPPPPTRLPLLSFLPCACGGHRPPLQGSSPHRDHCPGEQAEDQREPREAAGVAFELEADGHRTLAVHLHAAVECQYGAAFRQGDIEGQWRGFGGELLGHQAVGDFLERGVLVGCVAF